VFDIKEVRDLMAYDDMELETIGDRKTAQFIFISDTDDTFSFIAALMYSQLFNLLWLCRTRLSSCLYQRI